MVLLLSLLASTAFADSLRCKHRLVSRGDTVLELKAACGAPDHISVRPVLQAIAVPTAAGTVRGGTVRYVQEEEETWTYSQPAGLMRLVTIRRGKVVSIRSISRSATVQYRSCARAVFKDQTPQGEVYVACGAPSDRSSWSEELLHELPDGTQLRKLITRERWVYDPGPGRLLRIFEFEDGRLVSIKTGNRSPSDR